MSGMGKSSLATQRSAVVKPRLTGDELLRAHIERDPFGLRAGKVRRGGGRRGPDGKMH